MADVIINMCDNINDIENNPFFVKIKNPNINLGSFINTQILFSKSVDHWSKVLGQLVNLVPSDKERMVIIKNLWDEHGNGNIHNSHVRTFDRFIESLKSVQKYTDNVIKSNPAMSFNNKLDNMLKNKSWVYSTAALGAIEYIYITVSKNINDYAVKFVEQDKIEHYSMHEIIDIQHSTELFSIVPTLNKNNITDMIDITEGIKYGYDIFYKLYFELSEYLIICDAQQ